MKPSNARNKIVKTKPAEVHSAGSIAAFGYWGFGVSRTNFGASSSHFESSQYARVLAVFSAWSCTSP
jgi:hypothetical protein